MKLPACIRSHCVATILCLLATVLATRAPASAMAQTDSALRRPSVRVFSDDTGKRLQVGGHDFFVRGMNWDYTPIGQNYAFDLWQQADEVITAALDHEMSLLAGMGVNTLRIYTGIPPRWVRYIYDRYGIYCIINHPVGRYGYTLDGVWRTSVDYSELRMRAALAADVAAMVETYRGTPGVLMYLLGNENNYGLSWSSFEIEALPKGDRDTARARFLYSLFGEIARATKARDPGVPVAIANGDLQYIDVIAAECKGIDVFGTNVYRGISSRDLFQVVRDKLHVPLLYTEFGSDAFNARDMREDQTMQARYLIGLWREIYEKSAGHGQEGNAIGGCVFQWSDGWWKYKQEERLDVHDTNASWPNSGYTEDYVQGENNMNEEWWGICARGYPDSRGLYELYPRAGYYALRKVFELDPYAPTTTNEVIRAHFDAITPSVAALQARADRAALATNALERVRVSGVRLQFETISTGANLTRPPQFGDPSFRGFDKFQSFYTDLQANPSPAVTGKLSLNVRGNVPTNTIDQIFYENRSTDRVKVYQSSLSWDDRWFGLDGFYRTGHFHWGYEGDFFGLYREANYGPNVDTYDAEAPVGVEMAAKRSLSGLKLAFGPQLWWGAPPAALLKYRRQVGRFDATAVYEKDIDTQGAFTIVGSSFVALKPTQKGALHLKTAHGPFTLEAGGIWAGANYFNDPFPVSDGSGDSYRLLQDRVHTADEFGGKFRVSAAQGRLQWYVQGASMGPVAEGGPTGTNNYVGWTLKDSGLGNQRNVIGGFAYGVGHFQFGPNFLWQKPIVAPLAKDDRNQGVQRSLLDSPFAVRGNREMTAGEIIVAYDPTPATWLFAWDNDVREDSRFAGSVGFVYKHMPTSMDAAIGFLSDGVTPFVFDGSTPPRDLWEVNGRGVSRLGTNLRVVVHAYVGVAEPTLSPDPRLVRRRGADIRLTGGSTSLTAYAKFDDFGPYDFFRDFNLTYPVQLMGDLSHTLGSPLWFETNPQTRIGVRGTWRSLDSYSLRYIGITGDPNGNEWEVRTYVRLAI
ncbi:MAG: glycosidase [Candidatus Eisenbacteria bacterium]|uniref:Glycosidase n=1 Tax=Eiseniibacteriota bacterium TaxID=2212470 RepID=A0A849SCJ7_UNCEI|nr:glycosidase [Candidatus Eisenbacteria bacterium]